MVELTKLQIIDKILINNSIPIELYKEISKYLGFNTLQKNDDLQLVLKFFDLKQILHRLIELEESKIECHYFTCKRLLNTTSLTKCIQCESLFCDTCTYDCHDCRTITLSNKQICLNCLVMCRYCNSVFCNVCNSYHYCERRWY
jgi:hypothetical protein